MSTFIDNYPVFEDNQVLTSSQLNQLQNYLDRQNRMTRSSLIGIGVVCGLDIICSPAHDKLTITEGVGVTSEGHLITICDFDCETTRYRTYTKPNSVSYPPFEDPVTQLQNIELFELLTEEAETHPEDTITDLSEEFLEDKVVLLFLEYDDKDLKSCLGKSCDELGIDRTISLRKLLISKEDLTTVKDVTNGGILKNAFPEKYELPVIQIKRPFLKPETPGSLYYIGMAAEYLKAIEEVWDPLFEVLHKSYDVYKPILEDVYSDNPFESEVIANIKNELEEYLASYSDFSEPVFGIQYFYDLVKDIILAYEEFRLTAFELSGACCPDISRFPKHLLLGEACGEYGGLCAEVEYRNEFVASPVFSDQRYLSDKVKMLHERLVLLLESFDLERLNEPEEWEIKITPSSEKQSYISDRAIPFYYNSKLESSFDEIGTLESNWDFDLQRQCRNGELPVQLSYDNHNPDSEIDNPILTPLKYNLDLYNFLRIEGHISRHVEEVEDELLEIKNENNLSFDVKKVYFGDLAEEESLPDCLISDLQTQYSIWRNKILLLLKNLVRTSKTAERTILNRNMISFEEEANFSKKTSFGGKRNIGFNTSDFTNLFMGVDPKQFNESAGHLYTFLNNFERASSPDNVSLSASYESYTDSSIRDMFTFFNNCLHQLIDAMPREFQEFDMQIWLKHYKCALRVIVRIMKWLAGYANDPQSRIRVIVYLLIVWAIHRVLSFLAIYPYITIRILNDTMQERQEALMESLQLSLFRGNHPGIEHKAGVAQGQTFLLAYQLPHQIEDFDDDEMMRKLLKLPFSSGDQNLDFEKYLEMTSEMEGLVVADFTLPFICCDECEDVPSVAVTLDPFAPPVSAIAKTDNLQEISEYKPVEIQLINDLYEPDIYEASITSNPNLGTYKFREDPYEPDNNKTKQILIYKVDPQKVAAEMKRTDDFFIIDEFEYQIRDVNRDEVVGSDTITIFIPVAQNVKPQTGTVTGTVEAINDQGNREQVVGANVMVEGTALGAATNVNGAFTLENVPIGTQILNVSYVGYRSVEEEINVSEGTNTVNIVLNPVENITINYGRILEAKEVVDNTEDAEKLKKYYSTTMDDAKRKADAMVEREGVEEVTTITKSAATVKEFSDEEDISVVRLNNEYNKRRNELVAEIQNTEGSEQELRKKTLNNLTLAYLNRLAYTQPKELTSTTKGVLNESATIFNSESDIDIKKTVEKWKENSKGYISEDFENNLNDNFKLS